MKSFDESVKSFCEDLERCLGTDALNKGYALGIEDRTAAFDLAEKKYPGHAAGEISYKLDRFTSLHDPKDMIKIAAWAFLLWNAEQRRRENLAGPKQAHSEALRNYPLDPIKKPIV